MTLVLVALLVARIAGACSRTIVDSRVPGRLWIKSVGDAIVTLRLFLFSFLFG